MPIINPDLSDALDMSPIEPGTYKARIEAVTAKTSSKGNPMIEVDFVVFTGDREAPRKTWLVISGAGAYGFEQLLRATGFDDIADAYKDKSATKPPFDTDNFVGQELNVVIVTEMYNNEPRDKISTYLRA